MTTLGGCWGNSVGGNDGDGGGEMTVLGRGVIAMFRDVGWGTENLP